MEIHTFGFDCRKPTPGGKYSLIGIKFNLPVPFLTDFPGCNFCFYTERDSSYKVPYGRKSKFGVHNFSTLELLDEFSRGPIKFTNKPSAGIYHSMLFLMKGRDLPSEIGLTIYNVDNEIVRYFVGKIFHNSGTVDNYGTLVDYRLRNLMNSQLAAPRDLRENLKRKRVEEENEESGEIKAANTSFASSTFEDLEKLFQ